MDIFPYQVSAILQNVENLDPSLNDLRATLTTHLRAWIVDNSMHLDEEKAWDLLAASRLLLEEALTVPNSPLTALLEHATAFFPRVGNVPFSVYQLSEPAFLKLCAMGFPYAALSSTSDLIRAWMGRGAAFGKKEWEERQRASTHPHPAMAYWRAAGLQVPPSYDHPLPTDTIALLKEGVFLLADEQPRYITNASDSRLDWRIFLAYLTVDNNPKEPGEIFFYNALPPELRECLSLDVQNPSAHELMTRQYLLAEILPPEDLFVLPATCSLESLKKALPRL